MKLGKRTSSILRLTALIVVTIMICIGIPLDMYASEYDEVRLLALVADELAPNGSYTVLAAISSVMLNREKSPMWPNTLSAVIVASGVDIINIIEIEPSERAMRAAADALGGFDVTSGATNMVYFGDAEEYDINRARLCFEGWAFY